VEKRYDHTLKVATALIKLPGKAEKDISQRWLFLKPVCCGFNSFGEFIARAF